MSDYPMLISNKLHSFRNFTLQFYEECITLTDGILALNGGKTIN